jgi:hypothetical protein
MNSTHVERQLGTKSVIKMRVQLARSDPTKIWNFPNFIEKNTFFGRFWTPPFLGHFWGQNGVKLRANEWLDTFPANLYSI